MASVKVYSLINSNTQGIINHIMVSLITHTLYEDISGAQTSGRCNASEYLPLESAVRATLGVGSSLRSTCDIKNSESKCSIKIVLLM